MTNQFIYPPPNSDTTVLDFNYLDSVDVSWETTNTNSSEAYLTLWYYLSDEPWAVGYNESVGLNGSRTVNLNIIEEGYYGQFNFDFGSDAQYLSCFFSVAYNTTQNPVTWTGSGASTITASAVSTSSTSSSSSSSTTSTKSSTISATSSTTSATSTLSASSSSTPSSSSGLSKGATAGIAVGVIAGVLTLASVGIYLFWRRKNNPNRNTIRYELTTNASPRPPIQEKFSETQYGPSVYAELSEDRGVHELPSSQG